MSTDFLVSPIHVLVVIPYTDDVFDDTQGDMSVVGIFADFFMAHTYRMFIASNQKHGDRLVIFSSQPIDEIALVDVLVVSCEGLN